MANLRIKEHDVFLYKINIIFLYIRKSGGNMSTSVTSWIIPFLTLRAIQHYTETYYYNGSHKSSHVYLIFTYLHKPIIILSFIY